MHDDGKVAPIHKIAAQVTLSPLARLPVVLIQVRDKAAQQLGQGLQELFDNADDTLFEMADKARNRVDHHIFFEAMRDVRLKRKSIERGFMAQLFEAFANLGQAGRDELQLQPIVSYNTLSGVSDDELEKTVALESMLGKVSRRDGLALGNLTARLSHLLGRQLDDRENPLGPVLLCEFFLQAGRSQGMEIQVKLIILKLFEKYVLSSAEQLYGEANQLLIATGVLPELKGGPSRRLDEPAVRTHMPEAGIAADADDGSQTVFTALQELLYAVRGSVAPTLEASAQPQPISTRDLLRLLSHLQQYVPPAQVEDDFDLRNQLEQLLTRVSVKSGKSRVVDDADEDVINLIAMLFDFILGDPTLPDSLKALIARLQIPMLKVAVLDKGFFSQGSHPARRLLNEIGLAAMGWGRRDDCQRDNLYLHIEQVVQRLLNDFVDDPAIFAQLLVEFTAFTQDEQRRSELLEQRTRDAEEGRALTEVARQRVADALDLRLVGHALPQIVVQFLQQSWSQVLLLAYLTHGEPSEQWNLGLRTMDELIWSVGLNEEPGACTHLLERLPGILQALREGLSGIAFDPFTTREFFTRLQGMHLRSLQKNAANRSLLAMIGVQVEMRDEIVLNPVVPTRTVKLADDDPDLLKVRKLRVGSWVEFQEDSENTLRCKLTAIIPASGAYIFVNRTGLKVRERTCTELALEFKRKTVWALDDALLFDRALASVIGNLRQLNHAK